MESFPLFLIRFDVTVDCIRFNCVRYYHKDILMWRLESFWITSWAEMERKRKIQFVSVLHDLLPKYTRRLVGGKYYNGYQKT